MRNGVRCLLYVVTTLTLLGLAASVAAASRPPVELGEVTARVKAASPVVGHFRQSLAAALDALDLPPSPERDTYVLSASVVRLDERREGRGVETSVVVSATLRERKSGALRAILRSHGVAEGKAAEARIDAVRAAARSAVRRVPEALR